MMGDVSCRAFAIASGLTLAACAVEPLEPVGTTTTTTVSDTSGDTEVSGVPPGDTEPMHRLDSSGTSAMSTSTGTAGGTATDTGACQVGEEGCPCTASGACDPGLQCLSNFCVDLGGTCPIGAEGCPCTQGGACDPGLICASMTCVDPAGG